jgi:YHS domain-containing protein
VKKLIVLAGAALVIAPAALALPDKKTAAPTELNCPVMTASKVNIKDATSKKMFADYKGRRYFFCCAGCPPAFKADPAKYAKAASIATPKAGKGKKA